MENNKKNRIILIIPIVLIALVIALIAFYFGYYSKPEQLYKRIIWGGINSYVGKLNEMDYEQGKASIDIDLNLEPTNQYMDADILDLINNVDVKIGTQLDNTQKQIVVDFEADYNNEDLLDIQAYLDANNKSTHIYAKELLDKYLRVDVDEELYTSFNQVFETSNVTKESKEAMNAISKILIKEINNTIKPEYCSSSKEEVVIEGKTVEATKNTLKMTVKQFANEYMTLFENLKNNQEFLSYLGNNKESVEEQINSIIEMCKQLIEDPKSENTILQVNLYTTGLIGEIGKLDIEVYDTDAHDILSLTKVNDNEIYFETKSNSELVVDGNVKFEQYSDLTGEISLVMNSVELGKLTMKLGYSEEYNTAIDKVDVNNTKNIEDITELEQITLLTNLQKTKLFELIQKFTVKFYMDGATTPDVGNSII